MKINQNPITLNEEHIEFIHLLERCASLEPESLFLNNDSREAKYVEARAFHFLYLSRVKGYGVARAGQFHGKDHATVLYAIKQIISSIKLYKHIRENYRDVLSFILERNQKALNYEKRKQRSNK